MLIAGLDNTMLRELTIRNVAIIETLHLVFRPGLTILTGETGAGKSILIDALQLVLGAKSSEDLLRADAEEAVVEAAFDLPAGARALLDAEDIPAEPGEFLMLRRHLLREGKSKAYVNGRLASAASLRALAERLVDIHGQHPGQPLLDPRRHREVLDAYGGATEEVRAYRQAYGRWQALRRERDDLAADERDRAQRQDLLEFQRREIEGARLDPEEEDVLSAEATILANHERLFGAVEQAYAELEESEGAVLDRLAAGTARVREAAAIDPRLREILEVLEAGVVHVREAARGLRDYRADIEFDPRRLEVIEARLHEIGKLKRKYGANVREVLEHLERVRKELDAVGRSEARLTELDQALSAIQRELVERAGRLSGTRQRAARALRDAILGELQELGMAKAAFEVRVATDRPADSEFGPHGIDEVEFLISPNPGEASKPLHKIASGGELSRVMLAIRTILAAADETPTVIYDEIDAGIGGSMAEVVGRKLAAASRRHQVFCVTHLPQIACFADQHLVVAKRALRDRTETLVQVLADAGRPQELARMLGGPSGSTTGLQHAAELLEAAGRQKRRLRPSSSR